MPPVYRLQRRGCTLPRVTWSIWEDGWASSLDTTGKNRLKWDRDYGAIGQHSESATRPRPYLPCRWNLSTAEPSNHRQWHNSWFFVSPTSQALHTTLSQFGSWLGAALARLDGIDYRNRMGPGVTLNLPPHQTFYFMRNSGQAWMTAWASRIDCECTLPSAHTAFVWPLYNVGPTSKTLDRHCTNVIQMFCFGRDPVLSRNAGASYLKS